MSDAPNILKNVKYMPGFGIPSAASNSDATGYGNWMDYSYPRVQDVMDLDSKNFKYGLEYENKDFFYQDPLFLSFDIVLDTTRSPLLASPPFRDSLKEFFDKYNTIPSIVNRVKVYNEFRDILTRLFNVDHHSINPNKSYYINSIAGLDKISARIVDYQKDKITITLNDDVTMISTLLASLYNNLCYSYKDQRFMIPQNLLRFNMYLMISDMRNMPMLDISGDGTVNKTFKKSSIVYKLLDCNFNFFESRNFEDTITAGGFEAGKQDKTSSLKFDIFYKSIEHEIYNPFLGGSITGDADEKINNKLTSIFIPGTNDLNIHTVFNGNIKKSEDIEKLSRLINDISVSDFVKKNKKDPTKELNGITDQFKAANEEDLEQRKKSISGSKSSFNQTNLNFISDAELEANRKSSIKNFRDSTYENPQFFLNQASERMAIMNSDTGLIDDTNSMFAEIDAELSRSDKLRRALMSELYVDNLMTIPLRVGDIFYHSLNHYRYDVLNVANDNNSVYYGHRGSESDPYSGEPVMEDNGLNGDEIIQEVKPKFIHDVWKINTQFVAKTEDDLGTILTEQPKEKKKSDLGDLVYVIPEAKSLEEVYIDSTTPELKNADLGNIDMEVRVHSDLQNVKLYEQTTKKTISDLGKLVYTEVNPHIVLLGDLYDNAVTKPIPDLGKIDQSFELHEIDMGKVDQSFTEKVSLDLEKINMTPRVIPITDMGTLYSNAYNPRVVELGVLFKDVEKNNILELTYLYSKFEKFKYLEDLHLYNNSINVTKNLNDVYIDQSFNKAKSFNNIVYLYDNEIDIPKTLENFVLYNNDVNKENNLNFEKLYDNVVKEKEFTNVFLYDNSSKRFESIQTEYLYSPKNKLPIVNMGTIDMSSAEYKQDIERVVLYDNDTIKNILEKEYLYSNTVNVRDVDLGNLYSNTATKTELKDSEIISKASYGLGNQAEYDLKREKIDMGEAQFSHETGTLRNDKINESGFESKKGLDNEKIDQSLNSRKGLLDKEYLYDKEVNKPEIINKNIYEDSSVKRRDSDLNNTNIYDISHKHDESLDGVEINLKESLGRIDFNETYISTKKENTGIIDIKDTRESIEESSEKGLDKDRVYNPKDLETKSNEFKPGLGVKLTDEGHVHDELEEQRIYNPDMVDKKPTRDNLRSDLDNISVNKKYLGVGLEGYNIYNQSIKPEEQVVLGNIDLNELRERDGLDKEYIDMVPGSPRVKPEIGRINMDFQDERIDLDNAHIDMHYQKNENINMGTIDNTPSEDKKELHNDRVYSESELQRLRNVNLGRIDQFSTEKPKLWGEKIYLESEYPRPENFNLGTIDGSVTEKPKLWGEKIYLESERPRPENFNLGTIDQSIPSIGNEDILNGDVIYNDSDVEKKKMKKIILDETENDFIKKQKRIELDGENIENNNKIE